MTRDVPSSTEIRMWARARGIDVAATGRLSQAVMKAWEAAHTRGRAGSATTSTSQLRQRPSSRAATIPAPRSPADDAKPDLRAASNGAARNGSRNGSGPAASNGAAPRVAAPRSGSPKARGLDSDPRLSVNAPVPIHTRTESRLRKLEQRVLALEEQAAKDRAPAEPPTAPPPAARPVFRREP